MSQHAATKPIRDISPNGSRPHEALPQNAQEQNWISRYLTPRQETQMVAQQSAKGLFVPWPLLTIIVTLAILLVSGVVTLEVQVNNLSTTLLLRDSDHARQIGELKTEMTEIKGKNEQLQVYIQNDREKLVSIETKLGVR